MAMGAMNLYDAALEAILEGGAGNLESVGIAAALLGSGHTVDLDTHDTWSDVSGDELSTAGDYDSVALANVAITQITGGVKFSCDNISFGDPVTILDYKYLVLVIGTAGSLGASDKLLAIADVRTEGGTLGASASELTFQTPANGWFTLTRA